MRLNTGRSSNVEDRRGMGGMAVGGGLGAVVLALVAMFLGVDPGALGGGGGAPADQQAPAGAPPENDPVADTVSRVLHSTEQTWQQVFQSMGRQYHEPHLVLFTGGDRSACGMAQAAMGPFYCPLDQKVYIDLSFYRELHERFGAQGQFAEAYVIAHEVGHHVQNELGISQQVQEAEQAAGSREEANRYSVRLELQADCFAGVWAYHANREGTLVLEPGDVESAMSAATAIGDDRLQKEAQGYTVPDSFTHGTSEQRVRWLQRGLQTGDMRQCDTFAATSL